MIKTVKLLVWLCCLGAIVSLPGEGFAQVDEPMIITKEIVGEINYIDMYFISIIYKREKKLGKEYEMMFYIDKDIDLDEIPDLKKVSEGDLVKIGYVEIAKEGKNKRVARELSIVRARVPSLGLKGFKQ